MWLTCIDWETRTAIVTEREPADPALEGAIHVTGEDVLGLRKEGWMIDWEEEL